MANWILTAAQIKALREAAGLSQEEFAKAFHVSRSWYAMVETGARPITREKSRELALAFVVHLQKRIRYIQKCDKIVTNYL